MNENRPLIFAIDFDGVIVEHKYPEIGELLEGAKQTINELYEFYIIIIWTCRGGSQLEEMYQFLKDNDIRFHHINENAPFEILGIKPLPKIYADIYIDDHNLGGFQGWENVNKYLVGL